MNYFELHIGDYDKATAHLTACEDGIYGRLMRRYYDTESPLPDDLKAIQRFVRARARDEKAAVQTVLDEFFVLEADGWHHKRCDEEIAQYQDTQGDRDERRKNETERKRRYRARRAELFAALREHDIVPDFDTPIEELEAMVSRMLSRGTNGGTSTGTETGTGRGCDASGTTTQTPDTKHQHQEQKPTDASHGNSSPPAPTAAGLACRLMRQAGCAHTSPSNADLLTALNLGATPEELAQLAAQAVATGKRKPFGWAISTATRRIQDGEPVLPMTSENPHADSRPSRGSSVVERVRAANERAENASREPVEGTVRVLSG